MEKLQYLLNGMCFWPAPSEASEVTSEVSEIVGSCRKSSEAVGIRRKCRKCRRKRRKLSEVSEIVGSVGSLSEASEIVGNRRRRRRSTMGRSPVSPS